LFGVSPCSDGLLRNVKNFAPYRDPPRRIWVYSPRGTMATVEQHSLQLRKELKLTDLVLTQIMYVVGLTWVCTAAKLVASRIPCWLGAMAVFYVPQAIVVIYLSRRFPLEGGLYQWSKLGLNHGLAFLVGWNLWVYAIVQLGTEGLQVANAVIYAIG